MFNASSTTEIIASETISGIVERYVLPTMLYSVPAHGTGVIGLGWKGNADSVYDEDHATLKIIFANWASVQIPMIVK